MALIRFRNIHVQIEHCFGESQHLTFTPLERITILRFLKRGWVGGGGRLVVNVFSRELLSQSFLRLIAAIVGGGNQKIPQVELLTLLNVQLPTVFQFFIILLMI